MAGWETPSKAPSDTSPEGPASISDICPDVMYLDKGSTEVANGKTGQSWTKVVAIGLSKAPQNPDEPPKPDPEPLGVSLGSSWKWVGGKAPEITSGLLVLHWNNGYGIASFIARD